MRAVEQRAPAVWWGHYELDQGALGRWQIGPLGLWLRRTTLDWRYGFERGDDILDNALMIQVPVEDRELIRHLPSEAGRFGCTKTERGIELSPMLADRPVVARPALPFFVPPGQKIDLYISTPLWVKVRSGKADLMELPCVRPSDTWFGKNTRGDLSYATKTHLRRQLGNIPQRPHRAVTWMTIINASGDRLPIERLSIPVPQLSLFESNSGMLWTQHITLKKEKDGDMTEVELGKGAPEAAGGGKLVTNPRAPLGRSFASLIFGGLLDGGY